MKQIKSLQIQELVKAPETKVLYALSFKGYKEILKRSAVYDEKYKRNGDAIVEYTKLRTLNSYLNQINFHTDIPILHPYRFKQLFRDLLPISGPETILCIDNNTMVMSSSREDGKCIAILNHKMRIQDTDIQMGKYSENLGCTYSALHKRFDSRKFTNLLLEGYYKHNKKDDVLVVVADKNVHTRDSEWKVILKYITNYHSQVIYAPFDNLMDLHDSKTLRDQYQNDLESKKRNFFSSFQKKWVNIESNFKTFHLYKDGMFSFSLFLV